MVWVRAQEAGISINLSPYILQLQAIEPTFSPSLAPSVYIYAVIETVDE